MVLLRCTGKETNVTDEGEQHFLEQLTEICRLSSTLPWQDALQKALTLFAETVHAQEAILLLLDEQQAPQYCVNYKPTEIPILYAALQKYAARWQKGLVQRGCHVLKIPEHHKPLWLLPVPPHSHIPRGVMAFANTTGTFPQALFEQGGALLTPLVHNAQLQYADKAAARRDRDPAATRQQRQRHTYLESLYTLISTINTETNLDEILRAGLAQAMQIAEMTEGRIYLLDRRAQLLKLNVCLGCLTDDTTQAATFAPGEGGPGQALAEKWLVVEHDPPSSTPAVVPLTHVNLPLIVAGQVIGVMRLSTPNKQTLSLEVTQLLVTIADQLALTLQRGQLTDRLQNQLRIVRQLYEVSTAFLSQMSSSAIIFLLLRALYDNIVGAVGAVFYHFENQQWLRTQIYLGGNLSLKAHWTEGPVTREENELLSQCRDERMMVMSRAGHPAMPTFGELREGLGIQQVLCFPLSLPGRTCSDIVAVFMAEERPLEENETILAWAIVQQSLTALVRIKHYEESQKSESLLRAILESSRDGIVLIDVETPELNIRYINGPLLQMLALSGDAELWETRTLSDLIAVINRDMPKLAMWLMAAIHRQTDTASPVTAAETTDVHTVPVFETPRGLFLQVQNWPIYVTRQRSLETLFLFRDVTETKRLEEVREDLLSMLVHDMRNPLSATEYSLQLLTDPEVNDIADDLVNIALNSVGRLKNLVETILEIGRIEAGRFELHPQAVALADMVAEIARRTVIPNDSLGLTLDIPYDLPFLWVDAAAITRVFENLFNNALKFVPKKAGRVAVSATQQGDRVKVEVYNNGPHIPEDVQKRLFKKFAAGQYEGRGYGLGLAYCRLVVEAHGGNIWMRNHPEGGVSFFFTLPVLEHALSDAHGHQCPCYP